MGQAAWVMELLVATLCDAAVENQGKLNVLGAFDAIIAQSFPARFSCNLALRFSFNTADRGDHKFSIVLIDESDPVEPNEPQEADMQVNMPDGATGYSTQNLIKPLQGTIAKAGTYHFSIRLDGKVLVRVPLRVIAQSDVPQG